MPLGIGTWSGGCQAQNSGAVETARAPFPLTPALPLNLGSPESCRQFPLSPSEGERVGEGSDLAFRGAKRVSMSGSSLPKGEGELSAAWRQIEAFTLEKAVEPTQRRKGAETQGFRLLGAITRWVSHVNPFLPPHLPGHEPGRGRLVPISREHRVSAGDEPSIPVNLS